MMAVPTMSTVRFFIGSKRVATAVNTKDGVFFQVHPQKKKFASQYEWESFWRKQSKVKVVTDLLPVAEPAPAPAPASKSKKTIPASDVIFNTLAQAPPAKKVRKPIWRHSSQRSFTAPPGRYYIGDLCYVLGDEIYDKVFGQEGYEDGLYQEEGTGRFFMVGGTAYGDGLYYGSDGKGFGVDAGIIGITPMSCVTKDDGGGQFYTFDQPVTCIFSEGIFKFRWASNMLEINTQGSADDDY